MRFSGNDRRFPFEAVDEGDVVREEEEVERGVDPNRLRSIQARLFDCDDRIERKESIESSAGVVSIERLVVDDDGNDGSFWILYDE